MFVCVVCRQPCRGSLWSQRSEHPQTPGVASASPSPCQLRPSKSCATLADAATNPTWAPSIASSIRYKWTLNVWFNKQKYWTELFWAPKAGLLFFFFAAVRWNKLCGKFYQFAHLITCGLIRSSQSTQSLVSNLFTWAVSVHYPGSEKACRTAAF